MATNEQQSPNLRMPVENYEKKLIYDLWQQNLVISCNSHLGEVTI